MTWLLRMALRQHRISSSSTMNTQRRRRSPPVAEETFRVEADRILSECKIQVAKHSPLWQSFRKEPCCQPEIRRSAQQSCPVLPFHRGLGRTLRWPRQSAAHCVAPSSWTELDCAALLAQPDLESSELRPKTTRFRHAPVLDRAVGSSWKLLLSRIFTCVTRGFHEPTIDPPLQPWAPRPRTCTGQPSARCCISPLL